MKKIMLVLVGLLVMGAIFVTAESPTLTVQQQMKDLLNDILAKLTIIADKDTTVNVEAPQVNVTVEGGSEMPNRGTVVLVDSGVRGEVNSNYFPDKAYLALPNGECTVKAKAAFKQFAGTIVMKIDGQSCGSFLDDCTKTVTIDNSKPIIEITTTNSVFGYLGAAYSCV